jgi:hypothetical protein
VLDILKAPRALPIKALCPNPECWQVYDEVNCLNAAKTAAATCMVKAFPNHAHENRRKPCGFSLCLPVKRAGNEDRVDKVAEEQRLAKYIVGVGAQRWALQAKQRFIYLGGPFARFFLTHVQPR